MESSLLTSLFRDEAIAAQFSDAQTMAYMLHFEVALARVQSELGVIPAEAAGHIEAAASRLQVDMAAIREDVSKSGVPTIELIKQLRTATDPEYRSYVHWGATSQDVMDTALVMQLKACIGHLEGLLRDVIPGLATLARAHRDTLMAGRTHSQQALPITFGYKVAGWIAPLLRHQQRLRELKPRLLVLQLGGAVGTLASLGADGLKVQAALAKELDLGLSLLAWHTQRDSIAEFGGWLSLATGSLGKMAGDIILMAQSEVGEVLESNDPARGGSSTMPQKRNPVQSSAIVAAARQNATLLASVHQAQIQEHERATGSLSLEGLSLPQMLHLTASALGKAAFLSENLVVDADRMRANVEASQGMMLAEAVDLALAPLIGRSEAKRLIKEAVPDALAGGRHLVDVVRERTDAAIDWEELKDESQYLGQAGAFIDRVLAGIGS
jgi:3-carboxy-cis,cis-muconate cycloisomerase